VSALEVARDMAPAIARGVLFETVPTDWLVEIHRLQAFSLHCDADTVAE
jgi:glycerophosphoryl diester phosphodiesterase